MEEVISQGHFPLTALSTSSPSSKNTTGQLKVLIPETKTLGEVPFVPCIWRG